MPTVSEAQVRESFASQPFMATLGAVLARVAPGEVEIRLPFRPEFTQQHGFLHAGVVASIADSACGYAAYSLMPVDAGVLSVEYKINLMAPARGEELIARGRVLKAGRTLTVCQADVAARTAAEERPVATLISTVMTVLGRNGVRG